MRLGVLRSKQRMHTWRRSSAGASRGQPSRHEVAVLSGLNLAPTETTGNSQNTPAPQAAAVTASCFEAERLSNPSSRLASGITTPKTSECNDEHKRACVHQDAGRRLFPRSSSL